MLGIFGRGSSRKEASFSASHLGQELVTRSRLTLARSINRKLQALNSIGRMSWLQVLYQLSLRVEEFSFSRFLRFGHFGLWSGCEERVRHTCESRLTLPVPGFARREIVCMGVARGRSKCLCWELSCQPLIPIGKLVARGDVFRTITPALSAPSCPSADAQHILKWKRHSALHIYAHCNEGRSK
jgi:hypothetical protein